MMRVLSSIFVLLFLSTAQAMLVITSAKIESNIDQIYWDRSARKLVRTFRSEADLKQFLALMVRERGVKFAQLDLEGPPGSTRLRLKLEQRVRVVSVDYETRNMSEDQLARVLGMTEGQYFLAPEEGELKRRMTRSCRMNGYLSATIKVEIARVLGGNALEVYGECRSPEILERVAFKGGSKALNAELRRLLTPMLKRPFVDQEWAKAVEGWEQELKRTGYHFLDLSTKLVTRTKGNVYVTLQVDGDQLLSIRFEGKLMKARQALETGLAQRLTQLGELPEMERLKSLVLEELSEEGISDIDLKLQQYRSGTGVTWILKLSNPTKENINRVVFLGNQSLDDQELSDVFFEQSPPRGKSGVFVRSYAQDAADVIQSHYRKKGFLFARVTGPSIKRPPEGGVNLLYSVEEGEATKIGAVELRGVDSSELRGKLLGSMALAPGQSFRPDLFDEELTKLSDELFEQGYYNARIARDQASDLITYRSGQAVVDIHPTIKLGKQHYVSEFIILGNDRTRDKIIARQLRLEEGDQLLTPSLLKSVRLRLRSMSLFRSIRLSTLEVRREGDKVFVALVITLVERDFGKVRVSPGFRTDLGPKLLTGVEYSNLGGMARSMFLEGEINNRISFNAFDARRRQERKKLVEYRVQMGYVETDLWQTYVDYSIKGEVRRRRYYSFDSTTQNISNTLSREFFDGIVTASLGHDFERIKQFDATEEIDNGRFRVGSITPGLTLDLRNRRVLTTQGYYGDLSFSYAGPWTLSQSDPDLEVNFFTILSRNKFYIPMPWGTIAFSYTFGMQRNINRDILYSEDGLQVTENNQVRTVGLIPRIKVLGLTGLDTVRGFGEDEINRFEDGSEISDVLIQGDVFLSALRIEPRYFVNDSLVVGAFLDAGRVFLDTYRPFDLRRSVGITVKFVTPVGSIDFDYGVKLGRRTYEDGFVERPARVHVSIGLF